MEINITLKEIQEKNVWIKFCNLKDYNEWCVAEGLPSNTVISLTLEECKEIGLNIN